MAEVEAGKVFMFINLCRVEDNLLWPNVFSVKFNFMPMLRLSCAETEIIDEVENRKDCLPVTSTPATSGETQCMYMQKTQCKLLYTCMLG